MRPAPLMMVLRHYERAGEGVRVQDESVLAQRLATRAISLARSGVTAESGAVALRGFARGARSALELARARCLAAVDQHPGDEAARRAIDLLSAALRGEGS